MQLVVHGSGLRGGDNDGQSIEFVICLHAPNSKTVCVSAFAALGLWLARLGAIQPDVWCQKAGHLAGTLRPRRTRATDT
jgi:hypothetical protein